MAKTLRELDTKSYDPRWFIWTIVFLIISGVSLVSYILITSNNDANQPNILTVIHAAHKKSGK